MIDQSALEKRSEILENKSNSKFINFLFLLIGLRVTEIETKYKFIRQFAPIFLAIINYSGLGLYLITHVRQIRYSLNCISRYVISLISS